MGHRPQHGYDRRDEYYSKRGWAPNGDFRYKGPGIDHLTVRWNALLDRGVEEQVGVTIPAPAARSAGVARAADLRPGPVGEELVNQGGVDVVALGRKDLTPTPASPASSNICRATSTA